jgi:inorganic phosphate transporter, PiT family
VILLALFFTLTNGFQDGSTVCAAAISSRAMTPMQAICFVSACEFAGALFGGSAVALSIGEITTHPSNIALLPVLMSSLIAAISWNFITRGLRLPSSSTHALVGGLIGGLYAEGGARFINWGEAHSIWHATGVAKVVLALALSPAIGFVAGFIVLVLFTLFLMRATMRVSKYLRWLQWVATGLLSFGHGANDPQKSMGVIMLALHAYGALSIHEIPLSVRIGAGLSIMIGVAALAPGIVNRVGTRIFRLRTLHAASAETASAIVLVGGSLTGGPISASQVISSSVIGVGTAVRARRLHWVVVRDMLVAWFLTIPCSAALAFGLYLAVFQWFSKAIK